MRRQTRPCLVAACLAATALLTLGAADPGSEPDGFGSVPNDPWGAYGWDAEHGRFHQPDLATPIPAPTPLGQYDDADFDGDGVPNRADNCLLVPNQDQAPATPPPDAAADAAYHENFGPADMLKLSKQWKGKHPDARFRDDAELGEACSGYNDNYLRTVDALVHASNELKMKIYKFLGQSGPMPGGAANPFPNGKPTGYDSFGMLGGDSTPDPTRTENLPQNADGTLASGNMTPSIPMCSGFDQYAGFVRWLTDTEGVAPLDPVQSGLKDAYQQVVDQFGCNSETMVNGLEGPAMNIAWAGKRLYTNAEGGRITNRFVQVLSENPAFEKLITTEPLRSVVKDLSLFPYVDDTESPGQTRHGVIFRGESYVDGNDMILMDWRGFDAAWPLGTGAIFGPDAGMLIYDECRAIQTGVYDCTAVTDWKIGDRRHTFQEGYMPWVTKGPPSIEEYKDAIR